MIKRVNALLGHFWPYSHRNMTEYINSWKFALINLSDHNNNMLLFDFCLIQKGNVYRDLGRAVAKGWLAGNIMDLARHLAQNTNLANNVNLEKRTRTIYRAIYRYRSIYS